MDQFDQTNKKHLKSERGRKARENDKSKITDDNKIVHRDSKGDSIIKRKRGIDRVNKKAFAIQNVNKAKKKVAFVVEKQTKRHTFKKLDEIYENAPNFTAIVGGKGSGKSTLIRTLCRNYIGKRITFEGPLTLNRGKDRITLYECPDDLHCQLNVAKVADSVLIVLNVKKQVPQCIFEFLEALQVHGESRVYLLFSHCEDVSPYDKQLKKKVKLITKRIEDIVKVTTFMLRLKTDHRTDKTSEYLKEGVVKMSRLLLEKKPLPVTWRATHPYVIMDKVERSDEEKGLSTVDSEVETLKFYGYVRGCILDVMQPKFHIDGVGEEGDVESIALLTDPCPGSNGGNNRNKVKAMREAKPYAPMCGLGGLTKDGDGFHLAYSKRTPKLIKKEDISDNIGDVLESDENDDYSENDELGEKEEGGETLNFCNEGSDENNESDDEGMNEESDDEGMNEESEDEGMNEESEDENEEPANKKRRTINKDDDNIAKLKDNNDILNVLQSGGQSKLNYEKYIYEEDLGMEKIQLKKQKANERKMNYINSDSDNDMDLPPSLYVKDKRKGDTEEGRELDNGSLEEGGEDEDEDMNLDDELSEMYTKEGKEEVDSDGEEDGSDGEVDGSDEEEDGSDEEEDGSDEEEDGSDGEEDGSDGEEGESEDDEDEDHEDEVESDEEEELEIIDENDEVELGERQLTEFQKKKALRDQMSKKEKKQIKRNKHKLLFDKMHEDHTGGTKSTEYFDKWQEEKELNSKKKSELFDKLNGHKDSYKVTGIRPGSYVCIVIRGIFKEFFKYLDIKRLVVLGAINEGETKQEFLTATFKISTNFTSVSLFKSGDPLCFSIGWRKFQSHCYFYKEADNLEKHYLKYSTKKFIFCKVGFWAHVVPNKTGLLALMSFEEHPNYRIAATGSILGNCGTDLEIRKKLKFKGYPEVIKGNTAFIKGMFPSQVGVQYFLNSYIQTVSKIRGIIKGCVKNPELKKNLGNGGFRAKFEAKIKKSDIVFMVTWHKMELVPKLFIVDYLQDEPGATFPYWLTMNALKKKEGIEVKKPNEDSEYKPVERPELNLVQFEPDHKLMSKLPFKDRPAKPTVDEIIAQNQLQPLLSKREKERTELVESLKQTCDLKNHSKSVKRDQWKGRVKKQINLKQSFKDKREKDKKKQFCKVKTIKSGNVKRRSKPRDE